MVAACVALSLVAVSFFAVARTQIAVGAALVRVFPLRGELISATPPPPPPTTAFRNTPQHAYNTRITSNFSVPLYSEKHRLFLHNPYYIRIYFFPKTIVNGPIRSWKGARGRNSPLFYSNSTLKHCIYTKIPGLLRRFAPRNDGHWLRRDKHGASEAKQSRKSQLPKITT